MVDRRDPWNSVRGGVNQTSRTWTRDGVTWNLYTTSYDPPDDIPSRTLGSSSRHSNLPSRISARTGYTAHGSSNSDLFGATFGMFRTMFGSDVRHRQRSSAGHTRNRGSEWRARREDIDADDADDDDDWVLYERISHPSDRRNGRRANRYATIIDDMRETQEPSRQRASRQQPASGCRHRCDGRHRSHRHHHTPCCPRHRSRSLGERGRGAQHERQSRDSRPTDRDEPIIEALEIAIKAEREAAENCRRQLKELAGQNRVRSKDYRAVVEELHRHEAASQSATHNLNEVKQRKSRSRRSRSSHDHVPRNRSPVTPIDDRFTDFSKPSSGASSKKHKRSCPLFESDGESYLFEFYSTDLSDDSFDDFISDFENSFHFHRTCPDSAAGDSRDRGRAAQPPRSRCGHCPRCTANAQPPHSRCGHCPRCTANAQPPHSRCGHCPRCTANAQPPHSKSDHSPRCTATAQPATSAAAATVLQLDEAKGLYRDYNARWNALSPTDPNVPFPGRGLRASALNSRDTIWAPRGVSSTSTWSDETVMQANVQAFFLGVVGLRPKYTQSAISSKVGMGFDKSHASSHQIKDLIDILKKEKSRWHSDRLGRRNGGAGGINEALQKNERARAVFHAVCELVETTL